MANSDKAIIANIKGVLTGMTSPTFAKVMVGSEQSYFQDENWPTPCAWVLWAGSNENEFSGEERRMLCHVGIGISYRWTNPTPGQYEDLVNSLIVAKDAILDALEADPTRGGICLANWQEGTAVESIEVSQEGPKGHVLIRLQCEYYRSQGTAH